MPCDVDGRYGTEMGSACRSKVGNRYGRTSYQARLLRTTHGLPGTISIPAERPVGVVEANLRRLAEAAFKEVFLPLPTVASLARSGRSTKDRQPHRNRTNTCVEP